MYNAIRNTINAEMRKKKKKKKRKKKKEKEISYLSDDLIRFFSTFL